METVNSANQLLQSLQIKKHLPQGCEWWSKYVYHFSHVTNIASILNDDLIRCRNQVEKLDHGNLNDNASNDVIDGTEDGYKDYVRFYFRPLTPTQYHNEGIRAKNEITNLRAHCPIPVFLLFDSEFLDESNVFFSYESLASHYDVQLYQGIQRLSEAPFNYIYHNDSTFNLDGTQIRKHRQAEIVVKGQCDLKYLKKIVCRTKAEAETLKALLESPAYGKYADRICFIDEGGFDTSDATTLFYGNHLSVLEVQQSKANLTVELNKVDDNNVRDIEIRWFDKNGNCICKFIKESYRISNLKSGKLGIKMNDFLINYDFVKLELKLDGSLIYCNEFHL